MRAVGAIVAISLSACPPPGAAAAPGQAGDRAAAIVAGLGLNDLLAFAITRHRLEGDGRGAAFLEVPRAAHLPDLYLVDGGIGVGDPRPGAPADQAVSLPSSLSVASSWDTDIAFAGGAMIGEEARRKGFNVLLAGGVNLARDPRGGRTFEYSGEDPLLAGSMAGSLVRGVQSRHVMSTLKHFVLNDLETARMTASGQIGEQALRESDLLAFEIAIETGHPGAIMCAYNRVNDIYACENRFLLDQVLKHDWHYPGFVMSDWGATHSSVRSALAGLDQESAGRRADARPFFGDDLGQAVKAGAVPEARVRDMARRVVASMLQVDVAPRTATQGRLDLPADTDVAGRAEEAGAVLLRNDEGLLPLSPASSVAVIGGHADVGVLSGGGSSQVMPIGGNPVAPVAEDAFAGGPIYDPSPPLVAIRREAPHARVVFASGLDIASAARAARESDVAIVFATNWSQENMDLADLSLEPHQNALIEAVAAANPHTVVVLETAGPVTMPWLARTRGVMEAWYPGSGGGPAIARLLYGKVNPGGHLPITFPRDVAQLPRPEIPQPPLTLHQLQSPNSFTYWQTQSKVDQEILYSEGADVGYRWFARTDASPLFPFGFGLGYTTFGYAGLELEERPAGIRVSATVRNTGRRPGKALVQVYVVPPGGQARLAGWARADLAVAQQRVVTVALSLRSIASFDIAQDRWIIPAGSYEVRVGSSAADTILTCRTHLQSRSLPPLARYTASLTGRILPC